jgi:hypothetical protein
MISDIQIVILEMMQIKNLRRRPKRRNVVVRLVPIGTGQFVPTRLMTSLRASVSANTAATASIVDTVFSANSAFDPFFSAGAAQPVGFSSLAALYNRYRVHSSKLRVKFTLNSTNAAGSSGNAYYATIVIFPSTISTAITTIDSAASQAFAKQIIFTAEKPGVVELAINVGKFIGNTVQADRLQSLVTTNPSDEVYWHVVLASRAYTGMYTDISSSITYETEFFDRAELGLTLADEAEANRARIQKRVDSLLTDRKILVDRKSAGSKDQPIDSVKTDCESPVFTYVRVNQTPKPVRDLKVEVRPSLEAKKTA